MKNYSIKGLSVNQLQVDLKNPRLPKTRAFIDQSSVMEYLQEKENILEIADSIADNGIFPSEPLIAVEENGSYNVIEGNRRLVAMKLLYNPNLAIKFQTKFKEASERADLNELKKLNVIVYNDRISAAPVLIKRHTNDPAKLRPWEMLMKAHYTTSFMEDGKTLHEVATSLSLDISSLKFDLESLQLYTLAQSIPFEISIKEKINDENKFALSNLNRAINSAAGSALFKLDFNDSKGLVFLSYDKKEFLKPFAKLIMDIVTDDFNSRSANTAADIDAYFGSYNYKFKPQFDLVGTDSIDDVIAYANTLTTLEDIYPVAAPVPPATTPASPNPPTLASPNPAHPIPSAPTPNSTPPAPAPAPTPPSPTPAPVPKPRTRKRKSVIYQDVSVVRNFSKQRVVDIVAELKKIDLNYKNAAGVLLRTLLDIVTHEFIKAHGEDKVMESEAIAKLKPGNKLREFWTPELKPMLTRIINKKFGLSSTVLSALNKHIGTNGPANVLYVLNEIVHNPDYNFTKQDVLELCDKLEPYLQEVL